MTHSLASSIRVVMLCGLLASGSRIIVAAQSESAAKAPNADNAKNDASDLKLMRQIRRDVMQDKSLSASAKNVKIIAAGGKVTLRGAVKSDEEKQAVEQHAEKFAGAGNVTNELTIKS